MGSRAVSSAVAIAIVGAIAIAGVGVAHSQPAAQARLTCGQSATVIGARGSGESQGGDVQRDKYGDEVHGMGPPGAAFSVALANLLPRGVVSFIPLVYPAAGVWGDFKSMINGLGAAGHVGFLGKYNGSVNDGKAMLAKTIDDELRICPGLKLVLVGYSQGAHVVGDVYASLKSQRSSIVGVVLFGDPMFNPDDSSAAVGSYDPRQYGAVGRRKPFPGGTRVFSICHHADPVCQRASSKSFTQHENYQSDSWIKVAAAYIAKRIPVPVPPPPTAGAPTITGVTGNSGVVGGPPFPVTVTFQSPTCNVVGGTWTDQLGVAHDFGYGGSTSRCNGGSGSLVPGYGSCTSPAGQPGQPGQYTQSIVLRDAQGRQSAPFPFPIICLAR